MAKKEKRPSIFDSHDDELEDDKFQLKPESIVRLIAEQGKLPGSWCPYGDSYMPEKSVFINDEPPFPHKDGEYKK